MVFWKLDTNDKHWSAGGSMLKLKLERGVFPPIVSVEQSGCVPWGISTPKYDFGDLILLSSGLHKEKEALRSAACRKILPCYFWAHESAPGWLCPCFSPGNPHTGTPPRNRTHWALSQEEPKHSSSSELAGSALPRQLQVTGGALNTSFYWSILLLRSIFISSAQHLPNNGPHHEQRWQVIHYCN